MKQILIMMLVITGMIACRSSVKNTQAVPPPVDLTADPAKQLQGNWELKFIAGQEMAFDSMYRGRKPTMAFDIAEKKTSGTTGCNFYNGEFTLEGNRITFAEYMMTTKMFCEGQGEFIFLETLRKINNYKTENENILELREDATTMMRFEKK